MTMNMELVQRAVQFAEAKHEGQFRKYSFQHEPYIFHPMRVAGIVHLSGASTQVVAAAWLHDVLEDTGATKLQVVQACGYAVAALVHMLTNPSKQHPELRRAERKKMDREHLADVSDEAKAIKLADRIDNLRDLSVDPLVPEDFRVLYLSESRQLLEVLRGVDNKLESMLQGVIDQQEAR